MLPCYFSYFSLCSSLISLFLLQASFDVCRVFVKPHHRNSASENGLSSCAEESFSAVRHVGIQHDGYVSSDIIEARLCGECSIDGKNEIPVSPPRHASELDEHQVAPASVSVATCQCSVVPQGSPPVKYIQLFSCSVILCCC